VPTAKDSEPVRPPTALSGRFDCTFKHIPSTTALFGGSDLAAMNTALAARQAANERRSATCVVPAPGADTPGEFACSSISEPMSDEPFEMALKDTAAVNALPLTPAEREKLRGAQAGGPGVVCAMGLGEEHCFVQFARGTFKMRRVWVAPGEGGAPARELFEGVFSFDVRFTNMYARKGFDTYGDWGAVFFAIRAAEEK
jgi:hypothetical protein